MTPGAGHPTEGKGSPSPQRDMCLSCAQVSPRVVSACGITESGVEACLHLQRGCVASGALPDHTGLPVSLSVKENYEQNLPRGSRGDHRMPGTWAPFPERRNPVGRMCYYCSRKPRSHVSPPAPLSLETFSFPAKGAAKIPALFCPLPPSPSLPDCSHPLGHLTFSPGALSPPPPPNLMYPKCTLGIEELTVRKQARRRGKGGVRSPEPPRSLRLRAGAP